jgi:hypothetical protein
VVFRGLRREQHWGLVYWEHKLYRNVIAYPCPVQFAHVVCNRSV